MWPLLLAEAVLLSVLCVYLEKSKHPMRVYSYTVVRHSSVLALDSPEPASLEKAKGNPLLTHNSGEL